MSAMRAAILSIGDELTLGQCVDTNSAWLAEQLLARSVTTIEHRTVPDDRLLITDAVADLARRCEALIITGGLGPTDDDLTRHALGDVLSPGKELVTDEAAVEALSGWFAGSGRYMPEANLVQTLRPEAARMLPNPRGTAPGLAGEHEGCMIFALPGPPREMRPMFKRYVVAELPEAEVTEQLLVETVHAYGIGESLAAEMLGGLTARDRQPTVGITASAGDITARIRSQGDAETAQRQLSDTIEQVQQAWTPYCYGRGNTTLPQAVGQMLRDRGETLITAESCTGGGLGKMIVDVAGSSDYYVGGWVTYANEMKQSCLGVPADLLARHGVVSEPVAEAMAEGALAHSGASYSLAITGIAGPGAESPDKPAGTVFIALARRTDGETSSIARRWGGRLSFSRAFGESMLMRGGKNTKEDRIDIARFQVRTVVANVRLFMSTLEATQQMEVELTEAATWFPEFWNRIGAQGDQRAALAEFAIKYNASGPNK